jgi:plastocyanin
VSFGFYFNLYFATDAVVSPGGFTEVVVLGISHSLAPNNELVTLTSTAPAGINVTYNPASPVTLPGSGPLNVTLIVEASSSAALGNGTVTIKGVSGANSQSATFNLRVVQYRVVMEQNQFLPPVLNVTVGSTVYWQNLDGPAGGCAAPGGSSGGGQHNVVFTTLSGANSSTLNQFAIYDYTFTTPGSYFYYSSLNTDESMNGTINVMAAAGGMGDAGTIPLFSNLKGSGPPVPAAAPIASSATEPLGALDEPSLAAPGGSADGAFAFSAHAPSLSSIVSDAGAVGLLGLIVSCAAMAMIAFGKRSLTAINPKLRVSASLPGGRSGAIQTSTPAA